MFPREVRVLVIDDLKLVRKIINDTLGELGFKSIEEATDGAEAMERLENAANENRPFGLIFCDWNMPVMSGYDFLVKLRSIEALKSVPVIMVTAESEQANVLKAIKAGANDYLVKPISKTALLKKIEKLDNPSSKPDAA